MTDIVTVIPFELEASPNNAFLKGERLVCYEIGDNLLNLFPLLTGILKGALQIIGFRMVSVNRLGRFDEKVVELSSAPLSSKMFRKVGIGRSTITSIVWLMALGKFLMVQEGVSFSGGSCDDP